MAAAVQLNWARRPAGESQVGRRVIWDRLKAARAVAADDDDDANDDADCQTRTREANGHFRAPEVDTLLIIYISAAERARELRARLCLRAQLARVSSPLPPPPPLPPTNKRRKRRAPRRPEVVRLRPANRLRPNKGPNGFQLCFGRASSPRPSSQLFGRQPNDNNAPQVHCCAGAAHLEARERDPRDWRENSYLSSSSSSSPLCGRLRSPALTCVAWRAPVHLRTYHGRCDCSRARWEAARAPTSGRRARNSNNLLGGTNSVCFARARSFALWFWRLRSRRREQI